MLKLNELTPEKDLRLFKAHNKCLLSFPLLNWKSIAATMHVKIFIDRGSQNTLNEEKKRGKNELIYKTVESRMLKTNLWLPGDKGREG